MIKIENVKVYDLEESIRASKFPMAVDVSTLTSELTPTAIKLAQSPGGSGEDHWLVGVRVAFDWTVTCKILVEIERYHFFDIVSCQSTMHRIAKFDHDNSYCDYADPRAIELVKELSDNYNNYPTPENYLKLLYSNPTGMFLTARFTTSYLQLKTVYRQRKNHRLPEWREFCKWIETLPHSELICGKREGKEP